MRGCSGRIGLLNSFTAVFPAYAGMFPHHVECVLEAVGFPRVCGDVPAGGEPTNFGGQFSPRMRGCSAHTDNKRYLATVFPAYAGMFPPSPG